MSRKQSTCSYKDFLESGDHAITQLSEMTTNMKLKEHHITSTRVAQEEEDLEEQ